MHRIGAVSYTHLLIVVAIVGILVAISIPIFSVQLHKARVAADWANLRAYYSEIQADYIATGNYNPEVPASDNTSYHYLTEITFLDGQRVELKAGKILIGKDVYKRQRWVLCPWCGAKTRLQILRETELVTFPLFCPKCRHESIINAKNFIIETKPPDAKTQC